MKNSSSAIAFDTDTYLKLQSKEIQRVVGKSSGRLYIEFGGKLIQDRHSARVLPGYREDSKFELIKNMCIEAEIIFVVSAKDILRGRVRGDFGTVYDDESVRVLHELQDRGCLANHVAISLLEQKQPVPEKIRLFEERLHQEGFATYRFYELKPYKAKKALFEQLELNPPIPIQKKLAFIIGPGGGSGKFGVCLSQLYFEMKTGTAPNYLKFETFPVHDLPITHPLNLAFMAASADFYDVVMKDFRHGTATSYKRDLDNYELLHYLAENFGKEGRYLRTLSSATSMGINRLSQAIINDQLVQKEAAAEIARRLIRYKFEVLENKEDKKVISRVRTILRML